MLRRLQQKKVIWQTAVFAVLAQLFFIVAMAASPDLHRHFHHDADDSDHECPATQLISGGYGDGVPAAPERVEFVAAPSLILVAEAEPVWVASVFLCSSVFEHGPPALV